MFGEGVYGQIGSGKIIHKQNFPINISKTTKKKFINVSGGDTHVLGIGSIFSLTKKYFSVKITIIYKS